MYTCATMQSRKDHMDLSTPLARELLRRHSEVFKALGNEQRAAIVCALSDGEMAVSDIAEAIGLAVPNVSQHLRVLRESGVLQDRREGQHVFYSIANPKFLTACRLIRDAIVEETRAEGGYLADMSRLIFTGDAAPGGGHEE